MRSELRPPLHEIGGYFFDPGARYVSFHAFMTALDEVQTVAARFLDGQADLLPLNL